ncbi:MAG: hypothetical protein KJZ86_07810 [Caldilineaceae bacterium]|nr:hypothetical protein [Caldilineaceae bacterium]
MNDWGRSYRVWGSWLPVLVAVGLLLGMGWPIYAQESEPTAGGDVAAYQLYLPLITLREVPNSFTLIDEALGRGEIDEETALTYRVFATFGDGRLPLRFQGDDSRVIDSDAVSEATQRFDQLSPAAQETLVPFLIPPVYAGSWYDLKVRGQVATSSEPTDVLISIQDRCKELAQGLLVPLESEHFVIWYPPFDASFAERALRNSRNLEERIYPILTEFWREPLSDAGLGCNPSDGRYDIYMLYEPIPGKETTLAMVVANGGKQCKAVSTYMLIFRPGRSEIDLLAHEFTHAIQFAYNPVAACYPDWWFESTAEWAIDYFETIDNLPDDQDEHWSARGYLKLAYEHLWKTDQTREYGAYLWPFYLSHYTGSYAPQVIADIFAASEDPINGNLYEIINSHIQGGWEERWPEFALYNLNVLEFNQYEQWDKLKLRYGQWYMTNGYAALKSAGYRVHTMAGKQPGEIFSLNDLGIYYDYFNIGADVRTWAFANTFAGLPYMRVQLLTARHGEQWQGPFDQSDTFWRVFCQDDPAQRVDKILVIISNSNWQRRTGETPAAGELRLVASDLPCNGWQGSSSWQFSGQSVSPEVSLTYTLTGQAHPTFTLSKQTLISDTLQFEYQSTGGSATWSTVLESLNLQNGLTYECSRTGTQGLTAGLGALVITENLSGNAMNRHFFGAGLTPASGVCPGLESWSQIPWLQTEGAEAMRPWPANGPVGRLKGSQSATSSGDGTSSKTTSAWDLRTLPR